VSDIPPTWSHKRLDELGFVGRGRSRHRPRHHPSLYDGPYPFIQTAEITASDLYITEYTQTYSELGLAQSKMWEKNTLCIVNAGVNTGDSAILGFQACFPDSVIAFKPTPSEADVRFVKYYLDTIKPQIRQITMGATQDNLSVAKLLSFEIPTPPLPTQRKIAAVLSAYDALVENNTRRIAVLEEMARLLYQEWFVRFRFPGHEDVAMVDSELGPVPEGWETQKLGSLVDIQKGQKARTQYEEPTGDSIPYLLIEGLKTGNYIYTDDSRVPIAQRDDTIMVMDGASSALVFIGAVGAVGSTLAYFRSQDQLRMSPYLLYLFLQYHYKTISANNRGSAIPHANKDFIKGMGVTLPPESLNRRFHDLISSVYSQIHSLKQSISVLHRTRDLLLPRLVSGQVDVSELEIDVS